MNVPFKLKTGAVKEIIKNDLSYEDNQLKDDWCGYCVFLPNSKKAIFDINVYQEDGTKDEKTRTVIVYAKVFDLHDEHVVFNYDESEIQAIFECPIDEITETKKVYNIDIVYTSVNNFLVPVTALSKEDAIKTANARLSDPDNKYKTIQDMFPDIELTLKDISSTYVVKD